MEWQQQLNSVFRGNKYIYICKYLLSQSGNWAYGTYTGFKELGLQPVRINFIWCVWYWSSLFYMQDLHISFTRECICAFLKMPIIKMFPNLQGWQLSKWYMLFSSLLHIVWENHQVLCVLLKILAHFLWGLLFELLPAYSVIRSQVE